MKKIWMTGLTLLVGFCPLQAETELARNEQGQQTQSSADAARASAQNGKLHRRVEWHQVRGASGYLLEVRGRGATAALLSLEVEQPFGEIQLSPGAYQVRVAGLNKFGRPGAFSDWYEMQIKGRENAAQDNWQWDNRALIPGWMHFDNDAAWRGYAYIGGLLSLGAYGWSEKLSGDDLSNLAQNRLLFLGLAAQAGNPSLASALYLERQDMRRRYDQHQQNQRVAGWLAAGLYLWQLVDAIWLLDSVGAQNKTIQLGHNQRSLPLHVYSYQTEQGEDRTDIHWDIIF